MCSETFLSDIDLEANNTLSKYKSDKKFISYGFEKDFGDKLPQEKPFFVLPSSSVAHLNTEALRYAMSDFIKNVKEEENEEV